MWGRDAAGVAETVGVTPLRCAADSMKFFREKQLHSTLVFDHAIVSIPENTYDGARK
jgi:hypothetical protein